MNILVLNAGSSSLKSSLYQLGREPLPANPPRPLWQGNVDWTHHQGKAEFHVSTAGGASLERLLPIGKPLDSLDPLLDSIANGPTKVIDDRTQIQLAGHRLVHGGERFREPVRLTPEVRSALDKVAELAPVHLRLELDVVGEVGRLLDGVPQIAVFDTGFHSTLPEAAYVYPGPYEWLRQGIRRFGFHGISHQYTSHRAAELLGRDPASLKLITCHLGRGCSLAAVRGGRSIDTTMGFTPLEGVMMGSRSGSVDPGILIHLLKFGGYDADRLDRVLNYESGLKGISGISSDMRHIEDALEQGNERARLAFEMFVHSVRSHVGAMLASLGGLDALVFTAGIGENSAAVREGVSSGFEFLGVRLDPEKNRNAPVDEEISSPDSKVRILVVATQENWEIAKSCYRMSASASG